MTILGALWGKVKSIAKGILRIRKTAKVVKELTVEQKIEPYLSEFEAWQKSYNISQKRIPRDKWIVFDTMVNDLIDEYDYDYNTAVDEVKFMLETDPIDLDEGYQDFLEARYNI